MDAKSYFGMIGAIFLLLLLFLGVEGKLFNLHQNKRSALATMSEDDDIIDCVDVYKQPAFDHPLLKNHTIKMRPSFLPSSLDNYTLKYSVHQIWKKHGGCPEGTIPIRRIRATENTSGNGSSENYGLNGEFSNCKVEVARMEVQKGGTYFGATARINVWNINVEGNEWSLNSVSLFNRHNSFMESGWAVSPFLFGDAKPRIFVNWLNMPKDQGCFNLRCPGFVQVSNRIMLGGALPNVSKLNGKQFDYEFAIYKDAKQGSWWATFEGHPLGYWPESLFGKFDGVRRINWGGSVCNSRFHGSHTTTEMGSGVLAKFLYRRASYIRGIMVLDSNRQFRSPDVSQLSASCEDCYSVMLHCFDFKHDEGACIYYGGPGGRDCGKDCDIPMNSIVQLVMNFKSESGLCYFLDMKSFLGIFFSSLLVFSGVQGTRMNSHQSIPAVLTIVSEDGDVVDCIDIYKQPAFDHPLLKNHTIKMMPSFLPPSPEDNKSRYPVQAWLKSGSCPEGTIPVLRTQTTNLTTTINGSEYIDTKGEFSECKVEVARTELQDKGPFLGATGTISAWNLHVEGNEWSLNSVTVFNKDQSFMEIGWAVSPVLFGDAKPRVFVNWMTTRKDQGCFNLRCPGFVQVSNRIMLGGALPDVSHFDTQQFDYEFIIFKDESQDRWWAMFQGKAIGYWPINLIENFDVAQRINWGGSVCNSRFLGSHTLTEMGSGAFASFEYRRASYIRRMKVMNIKRKYLISFPCEFSAACP